MQQNCFLRVKAQTEIFHNDPEKLLSLLFYSSGCVEFTVKGGSFKKSCSRSVLQLRTSSGDQQQLLWEALCRHGRRVKLPHFKGDRA